MMQQISRLCLRDIISNKIISVIPNNTGAHNSNSGGKISSRSRDTNHRIKLKQLHSRDDIYLKKEVICKIVNKLLVGKKISRERLADVLNIKLTDLDQLIFCQEISSKLIPKINLPLIKLYCETEF